jgi:hypothetical protein
LLSRQVVYVGEGYTRDSIEKMLSDYQQKNAVDLRKFDDLSKSGPPVAETAEPTGGGE